MLVFEFWVVLLVFSFCGHDTDTYRTVAIEHGAFELCLPSLGFFFTKLTLRCLFVGQASRMAPSWATVVILAEHVELEHYRMSGGGAFGPV